MCAGTKADRVYSSELREHVRLSVFEDFFGASIKGCPGTLQDLSISGCCIMVSRRTVDLKDFVFLKLTYNDTQLKTIYCRVVWTKDSQETVRVGLQFLQVAPDVVEILQKVLQQYL